MRVAFPLLVLLCSVGCTPSQRVNSIPGFEPFDGELPAATTQGNEPELLVANIVTGEPGYFEFHVDGGAELTHLLIAVDDDVFVANVDDLELVGACDWLAKANSGDITSALVGLTSDCTPECEEACSCFQSCSELPSDLGVVGSPSALCTASCSQAGGVIDPVEFGETFSDIYGCSPQSCVSRPQWVGMIEVNYPSIQSEAIMAQPVSAPGRESLTNDNMTGGEISVGSRRSCFPY